MHQEDSGSWEPCVLFVKVFWAFAAPRNDQNGMQRYTTKAGDENSTEESPCTGRPPWEWSGQWDGWTKCTPWAKWQSGSSSLVLHGGPQVDGGFVKRVPFSSIFCLFMFIQGLLYRLYRLCCAILVCQSFAGHHQRFGSKIGGTSSWHPAENASQLDMGGEGMLGTGHLEHECRNGRACMMIYLLIANCRLADLSLIHEGCVPPLI